MNTKRLIRRMKDQSEIIYGARVVPYEDIVLLLQIEEAKGKKRSLIKTLFYSIMSLAVIGAILIHALDGNYIRAIYYMVLFILFQLLEIDTKLENIKKTS